MRDVYTKELKDKIQSKVLEVIAYIEDELFDMESEDIKNINFFVPLDNVFVGHTSSLYIERKLGKTEYKLYFKQDECSNVYYINLKDISFIEEILPIKETFDTDTRIRLISGHPNNMGFHAHRVVYHLLLKNWISGSERYSNEGIKDVIETILQSKYNVNHLEELADRGYVPYDFDCELAAFKASLMFR